MELQSLVNTFKQLILEQKKQLHSYSLGINHVFSGSAKSTSETFQEILLDTDCVCMP